jgi:hypothetical protein
VLSEAVRATTTLLATVLCVAAVLLAGCGGSSVQPSASTGTSPSGPGVQQSIPVPACSLLTSDQVAALLGSAPSPNAGTELDHADSYKTCAWSSGTESMTLGVSFSDDPGFSNGPDYGTPSPVPGLGDSAKFSSAGTAGTFKGALDAVQGPLSVGLAIQGPVDPASRLDAMNTDVRQIIAQLGS